MKGRVNHPHLNPPPSRGRMDKVTLWQATGNSQVKPGIDRVSSLLVIPERSPLKLVSESINRITCGEKFHGNDRSVDFRSSIMVEGKLSGIDK